jgi:hypothetical protein
MWSLLNAGVMFLIIQYSAKLRICGRNHGLGNLGGKVNSCVFIIKAI